MRHTITRRLEIDAGHRLLKHESKCRNVHGHRYVFDIVCAGDLDDVGRVVDFGKVKEIVGGWLDEHWDHGFIAQIGDPIILWLQQNSMRHFEMTAPPTAENMSAHLFDTARRLMLPYGVDVISVRCHETPNCWADYPSA